MSCGCGDTNRITIVRGNDTNFNGQNFVHLNITSDVWDLSTMKATIALGGITKTFEDLSNGIDLSYTAAETSKMPFGDIDGVLKVYNAEDQVATIESLLPFRVISVVHGNAIAVTPAEFNIEVKQGGETVMNIGVEAGVTVQVGTSTTLPAGSDATVTNSGTANHLVLDFGIPQGETGEQGPEGPEGPAGKDGKDAKINGVNTLTLTATDGLALTQSGNVATLSGKSIQDSVTSEATNRSNADNNLQQQIDAIAASSDVTDIVGTHADLEAYDTSKLKDNDIIKVLQDETEGGATTYYRWSTHTHTFTLIGEEGPYYTKSDADSKFVPQTRTVNNKALNQNITLSASDVGAATSAQGAKADTAVQPADISNMVTTNTQQEITAKKTTTAPFVIQNGLEVGGLIIGSDAGANTLTDNTRKMFRMLSPTNEDSDFYCADIAFDTVAQEGGGTKNSVSIGGRKGDPSNTAPDEFNILLATTHNATESNKKVVVLRLVPTGADFRIQPSYNGVNLATINDIPTNYVTTDTDQTITGIKQFNVGAITSTLCIKRSNSTTSGPVIRYENNSGVLGGYGISGTSLPFCSKPDNTNNNVIVRCGSTSAPSVGSVSQPVYIDSDGMAQPCSINKALNTLATSGTISPSTNTHNYVAPTGAITLSLPASPDTSILNEIELQVNQTSTVGFNFGSVVWGDEGTPDMSVGLWDFVFCYIAGHWTASYKKWETS